MFYYCPNVCQNINWVYLPRDMWSSQNAIALRVDTSKSNAAGDGSQLTREELHRLRLDEDTPHTKIEIASNKEYKYIYCWGFICSICCFPFICCIIKNCCLRLKRSQTSYVKKYILNIKYLILFNHNKFK